MPELFVRAFHSWSSGSICQYRPTLAIIKNANPYPNDVGSVRMVIHISCGINTRNIESGCTKQMTQAFLILTPRVVVKIPILKLANNIIPNVTKNKDTSLDNTKLANNPISRVTTHNIFPKGTHEVIWNILSFL